MSQDPVGFTPPQPRGTARRVAATIICALIAMAAPCHAASVVGTTTTASGLESASRFYVHCANGYYWVAYHNGTEPVLFSSRDAVSWTSQGPIFSSFDPAAGAGHWSVRYFGNTIVAFAYNSGNSFRYYRKGTLNSNGTVSWNAADASTGGGGVTDTPLNALIANSKPVLWRADATFGGSFRRGNQLNAPVTWTNTPNAPAPAPTTGGGFSAGAIFQTGGSNLDDLIVLRATTASPYTAGNHRLVAVKYNASLDAFDASWYNVSLTGGIPESATTEVKEASDAVAHRMFAAVRDTSGNVHAVYVNRNDDVVHYKKDVGFNDTWSRVSSDVTQTASVIDRVALTAVASNNFFLFYSKSDNGIYYRRFNGTSWGAEVTLKTASATPLQGALASMESASGCAVGLSWVEGSVSPYSVMFSPEIASCGELSTTQGSGTITVTAPASFEMRFSTATGGGMDQFFDLVEDPSRATDLVGGPSLTKAFLTDAIFNFGWNTSDADVVGAAKVDLLEATPTRVKVRQESLYQQEGGIGLRPGLKGLGDYSIYPSGRMAIRWNRTTTSPVDYTLHELDFTVHAQTAGPLSNWQGYSETVGTAFPGSPTDRFLLEQIDVAGARTDFLNIIYRDWTIANGYVAATDDTTWQVDGGAGQERGFVNWRETTGATIPAGSNETWNFLTYFKPTTFVNHTDVEVTRRRDDYRTPATLSVTPPASGWFDASENTSSPSDFFNESEGAYALNFDPASGLTFDITGSATAPRYKPFFKIRQWRSMQDPSSVTLAGVTLANDVDFKADVKPISRAYLFHTADGGDATGILWYSTLQNSAAVTSPNVGSPGSVTAGVAPATGKYGSGLQVPTDSDSISFPLASNFEKGAGGLDFWFQPTWDSLDLVEHDIAGFYVSATSAWYLKKGSDNNLYFRIITTAGTSELSVAWTDYSWRAGEWVHVRMLWNDGAALATQQRLFLNGAEPTHTDPTVDYNSLNLTATGSFYIGNVNDGAAAFSNAVYDEVYSYTASGSTPNPPTLLAVGGLTSNTSEYLASTSRNFSLDLGAVDSRRRGRYLYLGSDSKFRGVNVILATLGATLTSVDLQWQYWDGTSWTTLESVAGFTDQTANLTRNGTVFWTADPTGWDVYSVNGGPDLYYIRAYLASGSYSTRPVESLIKTDILLFQYCGDITAAAQTFQFGLPVATAVELVSFEARGLDSAVELSWQTASELRNLGFHLYRATSEAGPYERVTASLIPGLGSSPVGASYSYLDSGLSNGVTYFYKLEDVETTGKTELHGPVSATPRAGVVSGVAQGQQDSASPSSASSLSRITYGDPSAVSLRVVERGLNQVVLELTTGGFYATPQADGTVRIEIPGFEGSAEPGAPAIPVKRTFVEAVVGRRVRLVSVQPSEVTAFSLRPMAAEAPAMVVSPDGTVRAGRRKTQAAFRADGLSPEEAARVLSLAFQGEIKKALLELAPMRWDPSSAQLLLARRLTVRVAFAGLDPAERSLGGSRGRRHREGTSHGSREVLARLAVRGKGLYRVSYEETFGARGRPLRASEIRLSRQGSAVAFHIEPDNGSFGPGSVLYFLSEGASLNPYGDAAVYELERGQGGVLMPVASASPWGPTTRYCFQHGQWEKNRTYQAGLLEAPDIWLWDAVFSRVLKSYPFALRSLASATEPARLSAELQGGSDFEAIPDHHLRLYVNGLLVAETSWDGKTPQGIEADIAPGILRDGDNLLQIENVGDTAAAYSLVFLNRFALTYPRLTVAEAGVLEGSWSASGTAEIAGLTTGAVLDTTEETPRWLRGALSTATGLAFRAEAGQSYLAVGEGALLRPELRRPTPSTLKSADNRADYLLIAPQAFFAAAEPLLEHRRSQGLAAKAVSIEEIYEQFGYGEPRPEAVKEFFSYAYHHWQAPSPRYVVLLGDATYDFKNVLGTGVANRVPPLIVKTSYLWTASDPTYAAINGEDSLPDIAIGRLPASSLEEAQRLVEKILTWEAGGETLSGRAVLVADNSDKAGNFEADADQIASGLLSDHEVERIYLSQLGSATRSAILTAFDRGASLLSYIGHGGIAVWASENIFNNLDVRTLAPQAQQPLVLTLNCLNGYFHFPSLNSLAEELLKAEGRGAIAAFSPTGLSLNDAAQVYHKALLGELISGRHERLGDALLAAQAAYADSGAFPELLSIYHLLGDPALRLR